MAPALGGGKPPVYTAPTEAAATDLFDEFAETWGGEYPALALFRHRPRPGTAVFRVSGGGTTEPPPAFRLRESPVSTATGLLTAETPSGNLPTSTGNFPEIGDRPLSDEARSQQGQLGPRGR